MTAANEKLVRDAYAAFAAGDVPAVLAALDPNISWHVPGANRASGVFKGHDQVVQHFTTLFEVTGGTSPSRCSGCSPTMRVPPLSPRSLARGTARTTPTGTHTCGLSTTARSPGSRSSSTRGLSRTRCWPDRALARHLGDCELSDTGRPKSVSFLALACRGTIRPVRRPGASRARPTGGTDRPRIRRPLGSCGAPVRRRRPPGGAGRRE